MGIIYVDQSNHRDWKSCNCWKNDHYLEKLDIDNNLCLFYNTTVTNFFNVVFMKCYRENLYNMKYLYKIIKLPMEKLFFYFHKKATKCLSVYFGTYCGKRGLSDNFLYCFLRSWAKLRGLVFYIFRFDFLRLIWAQRP